MAKTTTLKQAKRDEESKVIKDIYGVIQYESIYPQTLTDVVFTSEGDNLTDELTRIENLIPDSFETLTIKETGKDDIVYDGSAAKEITLSSGGGDVNLSNYLAKDNETEYTPTEDYNPSTKKYIDDAIQTAIGDVLGGDY